MKKSDKKIVLNHIEPLSDSNENSPSIDNLDEFVLFPLDVHETNPIIQNTTTSQEDDFILFPLDINKNYTPTTKTSKIISKTNKPKRQFVTKQQPIKKPIFTPIPQIRTSNKKLRNLFSIILLCISIYTFINKESNESYSVFFSKTLHKISLYINKINSNFKNENDYFLEYKKTKLMIFNPYSEYIENEVGEINEVKGDSIIIVEVSEKIKKAYFLPKGKLFKFKIGEDEFTKREILSTENIKLDIDQNSFEGSQTDYFEKVSVLIYNNGGFAQEILVNKEDIRSENTNEVEVKYMRNNIEDFKKNIILTKYVSKSLLNTKKDLIIETGSNIMIGTFIKYEWVENDMFTFKDEKGQEIYFTDVPNNCILFNKNGVNKKYYNKKFKILWDYDNQSYDFPINKIIKIELLE
jgi:hypothetical protein